MHYKSLLVHFLNQIIGGSVTQKDITGLTAFTEYIVRVAAVQNDGEEGELSGPFLFTTTEDCK